MIQVSNLSGQQQRKTMQPHQKNNTSRKTKTKKQTKRKHNTIKGKQIRQRGYFSCQVQRTPFQNADELQQQVSFNCFPRWLLLGSGVERSLIYPSAWVITTAQNTFVFSQYHRLQLTMLRNIYAWKGFLSPSAALKIILYVYKYIQQDAWNLPTTSLFKTPGQYCNKPGK